MATIFQKCKSLIDANVNAPDIMTVVEVFCGFAEIKDADQIFKKVGGKSLKIQG